MEKVEHEKCTTRKKCNMIIIQHEKSVTWKKYNTKSVLQHEKSAT